MGKVQVVRRAAVRGGAAEALMCTVCWETGAVVCVPSSPEVASRYSALHAILPEGLASWSAASVEETLEGLDADDLTGWERALIFLAHHKSARAMEVLRELQGQVPAGLEEFAELAYAESCSWQGLDYLRERPGEAAVIQAAGFLEAAE